MLVAFAGGEGQRPQVVWQKASGCLVVGVAMRRLLQLPNPFCSDKDSVQILSVTMTSTKSKYQAVAVIKHTINILKSNSSHALHRCSTSQE